MKKNYSRRGLLKALSAAVLAVTFSINASGKTWDFTNWGATTVSNLAEAAKAGITGGAWSDVEKADGKAEDAKTDQCYWSYADNVDANGNLTANGAVISETEGLVFNTEYTKKRSLAIAVNYPSAVVSATENYAGPKYLWLGGGNAKKASDRIWCFKIPNVPIGAEISISAESHKPSADARGVELYVGNVTVDANKIGDSFKPKTKETHVWEEGWALPEGYTADGETVDIYIYNTNGCHLYSITVDDGNGGNVDKTYKLGVVSPTGDADMLNFALGSAFEKEQISSLAASSLAELQAYDVLLVSNTVTKDDAIVPALREAVAFQPMVNLSTEVATAWGFATITPSESTVITYPGDATDEATFAKSIFADTEYADGANLGTPLYTVTPGEYLKNDDVLAKVGDAAYILKHGGSRNAHILFPLAADASTEALLTGNLPTVLSNVLRAAGDTKKEVTKTAAPTFSGAQGKLKTTVTISGAGVVRYAIGADAVVDENSNIYTEPLVFTEATTVKAYAVQDGFLPSDVATYEVEIQDQAATPTFDMKQDETSTTVTINSETEGAKIYYTFLLNNGKLNTEGAVLYTEPIVVSGEPTPIYAIATSDKALSSEIAEGYVSIKSINNTNIRMDTVSHFSAAKAAWNLPESMWHETAKIKSSSLYYWGETTWPYYSDVKIGTEMVDDGEGNMVEKDVFAPDENALRVITPLEDKNNVMEKDWQIVSRGQTMCLEYSLNNTPEVGNTRGNRYADTVNDLIGGFASYSALTFNGKGSGDPYSAAVESVVKFTAPFDVVVYMGNGNGSGKGIFQIQTSTDGKTWTKVKTSDDEADDAGNVNLSDTQRYIKKTRLSVNEGGDQYVRVAQVGGGTKGQLYDIYILNHGEKSEEYTEIEEVVANEAAEVISVEYYNLNGIRIAEPANGFYIQRSILSNGTVEVKKIVK